MEEKSFAMEVSAQRSLKSKLHQRERGGRGEGRSGGVGRGELYHLKSQ